MKRRIFYFSALTLLLASAGSAVTRASAQVVEISNVNASLGGNMPSAGLTAAGVNSFRIGAPTTGPSFNDPRFFVLQTLSAQLNGLRGFGDRATSAAGASIKTAPASDASIRPEAMVRSVERLLTSPAVVSNPASPEAISAKTLYSALKSPNRIPDLAATLESVHPEIGARVASELEAAARGFYASGGSRGMLLELERHARRLESAGKATAGGADAQAALDEIFLGPLRANGTSARPPSRPVEPVFAGERELETALPEGAARLLPAHERPAPESDRRAPVEGSNIDFGTLIGSPKRGGANVQRSLKPSDKGLIPRRSTEPEFLKLLNLNEDAARAGQIIDEGVRGLSVTIVAVSRNSRNNLRALRAASSLQRLTGWPAASWNNTFSRFSMRRALRPAPKNRKPGRSGSRLPAATYALFPTLLIAPALLSYWLQRR